MHALYEQRRYLIPFRASLLPQIFCDVLVVGGGVAGLRAAIAAADRAPVSGGGEPCDVIVVGKGQWNQSSTQWAQGGIAAVLSSDDSIDDHVDDTLTAGAGLCDEPVVRRVVEDGPAVIEELLRWGMPLDRGDADALAMGREGGHSHHRIVHSDGDATGKALAATLVNRVRHAEVAEHVRLFDDCFVLDLITAGEGEGGRCLGAITHHHKYGLQMIWAKATILATGGAGQVYRETTNPGVSTGDGLAMAYRAGVELADLAFVQFHPTTLYVAGAGRSLITEAVRGFGGHLIDRDAHRFMPDYDPRAELAPRDVVSRSILEQMSQTGHTHVYLDVRHLGRDRFAERFPGIAKLLKQFDIDWGEAPIPVHPSAHYMIGGPRTNAHGLTSVAGLYACGEVCCSGLHGANRLASNSLLEGLVFGKACGEHARAAIHADPNGAPRPIKVVSDIRPSERSELDLDDVRRSLRSVMWRHVSIRREGDRLPEVEEMFDFWARYTLDKIFDERPGWETQNLLTVGALITRAARWRDESRGTHYRVDHPERRDAFRVHDLWHRGDPEPRTQAVDGVEPQVNTDERR